MVTERRFLQQKGLQLVRKEFMLHDRNNWPTVNLPSDNYGQIAATGYPNNVISHMSRQQPAYMPQRLVNNQGPIGPPPTKRQRQAPPSNPTEAEAAAHEPFMSREPTIYDEEDVSRGDLLDLLTPRDISAMRYKQHHEWLGEVLRSPYEVHSIIPGNLGLGRKGELESLTRDFFEAPTTGTAKMILRPPPEDVGHKGPFNDAPPRVGRMEAGKAQDFAKKAAERVAEIHQEMEKLRKQHVRRMAKLNRGVAIREAERNLRTTDVGVTDAQSNASPGDRRPNHHTESVDEIQKSIEEVLKKNVHVVPDIQCIQKGGLEEKSQSEESLSQAFDLVDQSVELSGQVPFFETPQDQVSSVNHTPGPGAEPSLETPLPTTTQLEGAETGDHSERETQVQTEAKEAEAGDWIMVNKEGSTEAPAGGELAELDAFTNDAAMASAAGTPQDNLDSAAEALPDFTAGEEGDLGQDFGGADFSEGVDFVNLDTAGEALSGYGESEVLGLDEHGGLGLDDSAFGDAFHSNETGTGQDNEMSGT